MKGLLLKDLYTIGKQMKVFLIILLIFAMMPGTSMAGFAIVYASMMPLTALAYDERCKWDELAAMMPYSRRDLVFSKYLLGYLGILGATLIAAGAQSVIGLLRHAPVTAEELFTVGMVTCVALLMQAVTLPMVFRFGVEKGRIALFVLVGAVVALGTLSGDVLTAALERCTILPGTLLFILLGGTILISAGSVLLSEKCYAIRHS